MSGIYQLSRQELKNLFYSPATYLAMVLALLLMGFFFFLSLLTVSAEEQEQMPATLFFSLFWVPVLLIVPMLTMRSFAEERRLGTIETLLTAPVRPYQLVFAKFFGAYVFYLLVWLLSIAYPLLAAFVLQQPAFTEKLLAPGALIGGYTFVALSGTLFVSVGIFSSCLTRSQLVAGMLSFSILFMLIMGFAALSFLQRDTGQFPFLPGDLIAYVQVFGHFEDFSEGRLDSRPFAYYLSGTVAILGTATLILEPKR
ncbi:MAG: ABC transporter permease [Verrucomicrobia bacterium]|jgi:ABC-2 type transport system permease protein|nr:ABC transporter permease [Verrucomicrobiota bacterium]